MNRELATDAEPIGFQQGISPEANLCSHWIKYPLIKQILIDSMIYH
jgi:hypothetical protein